MVGDPIRTGGGTTELTTALRADYDAAAASWAGGPTGLSGPGSMYEPLARSLVAAAPVRADSGTSPVAPDRAFADLPLSFERNLGQGSILKLPRGKNALWSQGGLMYSAPIR